MKWKTHTASMMYQVKIFSLQLYKHLEDMTMYCNEFGRGRKNVTPDHIFEITNLFKSKAVVQGIR